MKIKLIEIDKDDYFEELELCTHFNLQYNRTKVYEPIVQKLIFETKKEYEKEIRCLVTNAARAIKFKAISIKIPRDEHRYTGNIQKINYARMMLLLDLLHNKDYINIFIGGAQTFFLGNANSYETSVTSLKPKMKDLFKGVSLQNVSTKLEDPLRIRERETGQMVDIKGKQGIAAMSESVIALNEKLIETQITVLDTEWPVQQYFRGFLDNLLTGGRFYNTSGGVGTMPKNDRKFLRINGEETCELDYKACHPAILYSQINYQLPDNFDFYGVEVEGEDRVVYVNEDEAHSHRRMIGNPSYNPVRNLLKVATLIAINASCLKSAIGALRKEIELDKKRRGTKNEFKCKFMGIDSVEYGNVLRRIQKYHNPIAEHFFSDAGVKLQFVDSQILSIIMKTLTAQGDVCLPFHDSILVRASLEEQVKQLMIDAWHTVLGNTDHCKIEKK